MRRNPSGLAERTGGFYRDRLSLIAELLAAGETKALAVGEAEGKAEEAASSLLRVLRKRLGTLPDDLENAVRACSDTDRLERCLDVALDADTMDQFRRLTGL